MKFCGKRQGAIFYHLPQNEGKTTAERVGFALKNVSAKCLAKIYSLSKMPYRKALSFGAYYFIWTSS